MLGWGGGEVGRWGVSPSSRTQRRTRQAGSQAASASVAPSTNSSTAMGHWMPHAVGHTVILGRGRILLTNEPRREMQSIEEHEDPLPLWARMTTEAAGGFREAAPQAK